jgi:GNAT superfamily N-acetyltransferase
MWFAEEERGDGCWRVVGAAALRVIEPENAGVIQWLLVVPESRRQGVGRRLLAALETAAWDAGCRVLIAETLDAWDAAVRFYKSQGFRAKR